MKTLSNKTTIDYFGGRFRFLSNFYPVKVELDGVKYPTVEHAYQAAKTNSKPHRRMIERATTPAQAKRIGKTVPLRKDWNERRIEVMTKLIRRKFNRDELKEKLIRTGNARLVEGNNWNDTFWGICRNVGQNNLGKILMKIRQELKTNKANNDATKRNKRINE